MKVADIKWVNWTPKIKATLMFVIKDKKVLMILKKRGLGAGYYNGPGGKNEANESFLDCAVRETQEELCITPLHPVRVGTLKYQFLEGFSMWLEVFKASDYSGTPTETDEASPIWFPLDDPPYYNMWEDDALWFPCLMRGENFSGRFIIDQKKMLDSDFVVENECHHTPQDNRLII
jgi:8-oxo-dGTP diphosphatase